MRGGPACRTSTGTPRSSSPCTASPPPPPERDQRPFGHRRIPGDNGLMPDGPLIVQSDKSLLLEVDHPRADEARRAIAPFAELERAPEHIHTYRLTPLGLWNARAAGHDAEQVVAALIEYSRYPVPHALLVDVAETMSRYGRLELTSHPAHGLVLQTTDVAVLEEVLRSKRMAGLVGERIDESSVVVHASERGQVKQTLLKLGWPAEDSAGYVDGEAHPIDLDTAGWSLRPYQQEAAEGFWHGGSGGAVRRRGAGQPRRGGRRRRRGAPDRPGHRRLVPAPLPAGGGGGLLARRVGCRGAALRGGQDARRCRGDGPLGHHHAHPRHQHRLRPPVAQRAAAPHHADRGRDRGVLRGPQGDPAGDDRDLPGAHDEAEGHLPAPGAARRPRLGAHRLRRGPPAARADLPDDRRPAGPAPAGPDRDPGARGRPGGRGVLPHRPQALRRAVEGHRGAGLHRPGRVHRGWPDPAD